MNDKSPSTPINPSRRDFLKTTAAGAAVATAGSFVELAVSDKAAHAFPYEPYHTDDQLSTVVTSCAHNCGSRHMLVAHKKGDVIVRLSSDDGRYQAGGKFGFETEQVPQLRACLRGRSYRTRLYSAERLLYPMMRVGERGEGKFKRVSWDEALDHVARKMIELKKTYGPTAILDQSYAGASYGVLHKSDQIEGLLARFLGLFGCRTSSWSVPSYQGTTFSSRITFGTIEDGNEDDAFAHSKLIIMWGWNPAYTFHGGNTFYYMRMAKQRGCKFVLVDPQYTDSASSYDAWWIPIRPNTDAAMLAGMAYHIFANTLQDQDFIDRFCLGMDAGTMPNWATGHENFKDYILGTYDGVPKTPEWAARNCGVLGGCAEGVGKAWHAEAVAYPYDQYANVWYAAIKSDRWAHCVINYPNVKREEIGCWPRNDQLDGMIPNIKAIWWHGSDWFNQLTNINKEIEAIRKLELVVCADSTITPSGLWADVLLPVATHFERHDVALPWYKGHYYIHRPKVIEPMGESKSDFQIFTELAYRLEALDPANLSGFGKLYNPKAERGYFHNADATDESYLVDWWHRVQAHQGVKMSWEEFKQRGVYKFVFERPLVAFRDQIEKGAPFQTPSGRIEIFSTTLAQVSDWTRTQYGYPIPSIPKWIEPFEWLGHEKAKEYPFHLISPHPRWRTHSIFNNIPWLRETFQQEVTISARDAEKLGIRTGDVVEVWNDRGKVVVPAYVTERCMPGILVLYEGVWMDLDKNGVDRAGNPDFLTDDQPSPAGAFAYNTVLADVRKTTLEHRPGWDSLATARSIVFRRDY